MRHNEGMSFIDNLRKIGEYALGIGEKETVSKPLAPQDSVISHGSAEVNKPFGGINNESKPAIRDVPQIRTTWLNIGKNYKDTVDNRKDFEDMLDQFSSTPDHVDRLNILRDARDKFGNNMLYNQYITIMGQDEEAYYNQQAYIDDVANIGGRVKDALSTVLTVSNFGNHET